MENACISACLLSISTHQMETRWIEFLPPVLHQPFPSVHICSPPKDAGNMLGGPIARSIFCASALVALEKTLIRLDLVCSDTRHAMGES